MMSERYVTIIGGNLSGISTALALAQKKIPIQCHIYESHLEAWDKPCGGGFGLGLGVTLKEKLGINIPFRYTKTIIVANSFKYFEFPLSLIIASRRKLQAALFERMQQEDSIHLHLGKQIRFKKDWKLFQDINIVATGINGFTKQALKKQLRDVGRFQYQLVSGSIDHFDSVIFYMIPKAKGYAWLFPAPEGVVDIGIGGLAKNYDFDLGLQKFNLWVQRKFDIRLKLKKRSRSWGIPIPIKKPGRIARRFKNKLFIGVGDAVEIPDPVTAAGIEGGWFSGELVADAIKNASTIDLQQYATTLQNMMHDTNLTSLGERMVARLVRHRIMFPLVMSLIPNFLVKRTIKDVAAS